jgi:hypothetical protein
VPTRPQREDDACTEGIPVLTGFQRASPSTLWCDVARSLKNPRNARGDFLICLENANKKICKAAIFRKLPLRFLYKNCATPE